MPLALIRPSRLRRNIQIRYGKGPGPATLVGALGDRPGDRRLDERPAQHDQAQGEDGQPHGFSFFCKENNRLEIFPARGRTGMEKGFAGLA